MAPNKDASGPMPFNHSTDTSPTDTRAPHRFESITRSGDDDASTTTGTIRRNRPPAISTDAGNYGTFICLLHVLP